MLDVSEGLSSDEAQRRLVTMAAVDHVMLKCKDGKDVMVKVTADNTVKAKPAGKVQEIKTRHADRRLGCRGENRDVFQREEAGTR